MKSSFFLLVCFIGLFAYVECFSVPNLGIYQRNKFSFISKDQSFPSSFAKTSNFVLKSQISNEITSESASASSSSSSTPQLSSSSSNLVTNKVEFSNAWKMYLKVTETITVLFPVWTMLFAGVALAKPSTFAWFSTKYFTASLGLLMLSMGINLRPSDFKSVVAQEPLAVVLGFALCYTFCPLLGLALGKAFQLPMDLTAGLVLIGCVNGAQASNLCTFIARGNVALSVLMTTLSTLAGIVMTPLLCKILLGAIVPVNAVGIAISCLQMVLVPILAGMGLSNYFPSFVDKLRPLTPVIGVGATCIIVGSAVAQCATPIKAAGLQLQLPVILMHVIGGLAGYFVSKLCKFSEIQSRTIAIETAMKSTGFGFVLAVLHFKQYATRIPSAISVVWMSVVGASLGVFWRYRELSKEEKSS